jgi:leader peptidase (prepilin peptidase)/N-methyltransferase
VADLIILLPIAYIAILSIPLAITDFRQHRLPNPMTISAILVTGVSLAVLAFTSDTWHRPITGLLAGFITFMVGFLLAKRDAIGMGDVKLLSSLNAIAGYFSPLLALISLTAGLVIATLASLVLYFFRRVSLESSLPLGPYLLLGFFVCVGPSAFSLTAEALS